jgi:hypothetical protein
VSGIPEIAVGGTSFAVGDMVNVRADNGALVYAKPVPILRFEHYEDGFYYAVVDTDEMPRYHRIETLLKGAAAKPDGGGWLNNIEDIDDTMLAYDEPTPWDDGQGEFREE